MTTTPIKVAISGAAGRMGIALIRALSTHPTLELTACGIRAGSETLAMSQFENAGVAFASEMMLADPSKLYENADAVIDFSAPEHAAALAQIAAESGKILVSGTTGLTAAHKEAIIACGARARLVLSSNMSIGVNLMMALVEHAATKLGVDFDAEIVEMHHRHKVDAPSGTAYALAAAVSRGRNINMNESLVKSRDGHTGARPNGKIGISSVRGGDVIGDHAVMFAGQGERIELSHKASNRDIFAKGALVAVEWAAKKPPGFYSMRDVVRL
jgi:4-hydroxy-tetrahydrodipicolinate reductase